MPKDDKMKIKNEERKKRRGTEHVAAVGPVESKRRFRLKSEKKSD